MGCVVNGLKPRVAQLRRAAPLVAPRRSRSASNAVRVRPRRSPGVVTPHGPCPARPERRWCAG